MAGYLKLWTTLLSNEAYVSLPATAKALYYHVLLRAKEQRDDGTLVARSEHALGMEVGMDRRTCSKMLTKLHAVCLLSVSKNDLGAITIEIPNYKHWQNLDVKGLRQSVDKSRGRFPPTRAEQSRPEQSRPEQSSGEDADGIPYMQIIADLNAVIKSNYRSQTRETRRGIRRWWNQGFRLTDFQTVHRIKAADWKDDPKMLKFLRPSTLYGDKFENYLNQAKDNGFLSRLSEAGRATYLAAQRVLNAESEERDHS